MLSFLPNTMYYCTYPYRNTLPQSTCYNQIIDSFKAENTESIYLRFYGDLDTINKTKDPDMLDMAHENYSKRAPSDMVAIMYFE